MENILRCTAFLLASLLAVNTWAAVAVGEVSYARGILTGQLEGEAPRLINKGIALHNGETLNTGSRGFAVIELDDGTRMTLRPNTTFKIENVNTRQGEENAFLRLLRGGFRALTGSISKRNPNAFKISTSVATIGIRGTEFDARLCEGGVCDAENRALGEQAQNESRVIGRVALLKGRASATEEDQSNRVLAVGAAVYERDEIQTGINSFTVIALNDKTRVTMSPNSVFKIEEHEYKPEVADENNSFLRFLRGGLRLVTGAIGKLNRQAFRVATPTATIGIRGTGFDLVCEGECMSQSASLNPVRETTLAKLLNYFLRPVYALGDGNGMYAKVWSGAIELQLNNGRLLLETGKTVYLKNSFARPLLITDIPAAIRNMGGAPRPDQVEVSDDLFGGLDNSEIEPGLYVNVRKGDVAVQGLNGATINLGAGEASLTGQGGVAVRLKFVPPFQKFDKVPNPRLVTVQMENLINLLGDKGVDKKQFECTVQ